MALSDIVDVSMRWMDDANCIGQPKPFDEYEYDYEAAEIADGLCLFCPVVKECFEAGLKGQHGQWGGIYWNGSGKPDQKANSHKTEEYLNTIEKRVK